MVQHVALLDRVQDNGQRLRYARAAIEHGWSRDILVHQIETKAPRTARKGDHELRFRDGAGPGCCSSRPFKDPYRLDFIEIADDAHERHLERALIERIKDPGHGWEIHAVAAQSPSPTSRSFLHNHLTDIAAIDMFVVAKPRMGKRNQIQ